MIERKPFETEEERREALGLGGGRRLEDYVLDDEPRHPDVTVHLSTGHDGNIFAVIGTVTGALKRAGHGQDVKEFTEDVFGAQNYPDALNRIIGWVTVT
jgi:hypothetical protein